jgi:hypothetical protein
MRRAALLVILVMQLPAAAAWGQTTMPATGEATTWSPPEPASRTGAGASISIQAVQGTKGGPAVADVPVVVELWGGGDELIQRIDTKLDKHGVVLVEDLPLMAPFQPRVGVKYGGTTFEVMGAVMDAEHPTQKIDVTVYQTTEEAPKWEIRMRHVMISPSAEGLRVMEMIAIDNPSDRAWIGRPGPTPDAPRTSLVLEMPDGADQVTVGGTFHPCCTKMEDGRLVSHTALLPGTSQLRLGYLVPAKDGQARVEVTAPVPVKLMMVFLPEGGTTFQSESLQDAGVFRMKDNPVHAYKAVSLAAGRKVSFVVGNLSKAESGAAAGSSWRFPQVLAAAGIAVVVILCVVVLVKPRKKAKPGPA